MYMYAFTFLFKIRDCSSNKFCKNIKDIIEFSTKRNCNCKIYIIAIADVGHRLKGKVYHIQEDVDYYNMLLMSIADEYENVIYVDWKLGCCADDYVLEIDGHHLNSRGIRLLFDKLLQEVRKNKL